MSPVPPRTTGQPGAALRGRGVPRQRTLVLIGLLGLLLVPAAAVVARDDGDVSPVRPATVEIAPPASETTSARPKAAHPAVGGSNQETHRDPLIPVLTGIVIIILTARLGGHVFERAGQPAVLGELVVGVILGNLSLAGVHALDFLKVDYDQLEVLRLHDIWHCSGITIDQLARLGVLLLLFQVGLETSVADLRRVGGSALLVAVLGVVVPLALGWGAGWALLPDRHWAVHMFLGATLCATSVGITARVLRDLGRSTSPEARIILGAAVIDDVLGLVVLAVAQGVIASLASSGTGTGPSFGAMDLLLIVGKAFGFLAVALLLGQYVSRSLFKVASALHGSELLIVTALAICFGFAWLAGELGLAPIVGAFAAGLILDRVQYRELAARDGNRELEELLRPLADLFVPVFFVMMGIQVDLRSVADPSALGLAAVLIVAAVIGKQACALGVLGRGVDRLSVGLGMIPRGEVGIIFAAIGRQLRIGGERVIDAGTFSALLIMVMATTLVTPPLLKWSLGRRSAGGKG